MRQRLRLSWAGAPATYGTLGWLARYPWHTRLAIQMVGRHCCWRTTSFQGQSGRCTSLVGGGDLADHPDRVRWAKEPNHPRGSSANDVLPAWQDVGALPPDRKRQWSWSSAGSGSSTKGAATVDWQRSGCDLCCNLQLWRGLRTSP